MSDALRIDKWLWSVRLFKTRSLASEACQKGRILIAGVAVKPSRVIKQGEIIDVKNGPIHNRYRVIALIDKRIGAKLTPGYIEDITPDDQKEILQLVQLQQKFDRQKGLGRPTKKERRELDRYLDEPDEN
jgi:ribosome-associated heat shock protein Hsp15